MKKIQCIRSNNSEDIRLFPCWVTYATSYMSLAPSIHIHSVVHYIPMKGNFVEDHARCWHSVIRLSFRLLEFMCRLLSSPASLSTLLLCVFLFFPFIGMNFDLHRSRFILVSIILHPYLHKTTVHSSIHDSRVFPLNASALSFINPLPISWWTLYWGLFMWIDTDDPVSRRRFTLHSTTEWFAEIHPFKRRTGYVNLTTRRITVTVISIEMMRINLE